MADLSVQLKFSESAEPFPIVCPDDQEVGQIIAQLVQRFGLPIRVYSLRAVRDGNFTELSATATLFDQGVTRGTLLHLHAKPTEWVTRKIDFMQHEAASTDRAELDALRQLIEQMKAKADASERAILDALGAVATAHAEQKRSGPEIRIIEPPVELILVSVEAVADIDGDTRQAKKWGHIASGFAGATIGLVVNWVTGTGQEISQLSVVAVLVCLMGGLLSSLSARDAQQRADKRRAKVAHAPANVQSIKEVAASSASLERTVS